MSAKRTRAERYHEEELRALTGAERIAMACDMFTAARELVIAGMPPEVASDPRLARRYIFLAFYGDDFDETRREKILAHLDSHCP